MPFVRTLSLFVGGCFISGHQQSIRTRWMLYTAYLFHFSSSLCPSVRRSPCYLRAFIGSIPEEIIVLLRFSALFSFLTVGNAYTFGCFAAIGSAFREQTLSMIFRAERVVVVEAVPGHLQLENSESTCGEEVI